MAYLLLEILEASAACLAAPAGQGAVTNTFRYFSLASHTTLGSAGLAVQRQGPSSPTPFVTEPQTTLGLQQRQQYFSSWSLCPLGTS